MNTAEIATIAGQLKASGILTLFALWGFDHPATIEEIAEATGDRHTVKTAIKRLLLHGYAAEYPAGRWPRYWTTNKARQLNLPGLMEKISPSELVSMLVSKEQEEEETYLHTYVMDKISPSTEPVFYHLVELLLRAALPRSRAAEVIGAVFEEQPAERIEMMIEYWIEYTLDPVRARGLINKPAWIASKIENFDPPFDDFDATSDAFIEAQNKYIARFGKEW